MRSSTHTAKVIKQLDPMGKEAIPLFFVVPPDRYKDFGTQKLITATGKESKNLIPNVTQYVLELPIGL